MTKIERLREETYLNAKQLLVDYNKGVIIRPTGFGKTGILTRFIRDYKNVVFLYPAQVVKDAVINFYGSDEIPNTKFITYIGLQGYSKSDMRSLGDVDLIIADECHKLGAGKTSKAVKKLLSVFPNAHFLGATATPERMDLVDEISVFFENRVVGKYTLHDAFQDGVLQRPYYCFCSYGLEDIERVQKETKLEVEKMDAERENAEVLLRSRLIEISNLQRMDSIISETCRQYVKDDSYLKFIVFFSDFEHMSDKGDDVRSWFEDAYPNYTIDTLTISSETKEYSENTEKLSCLDYKKEHIDLIYCVDMMNLGYHVDDLTGIVMYRGTSSGIIFSQQLGRVLSSSSLDSGIVFDVVDNIHREAMYDVIGKLPSSTLKKKKRLEFLQKKNEKLLAEGKCLSDKEQKELDELLKSIDKAPNWWESANNLLPEDLIATGHEATYRELIAKTVAEPVSMRCRQAFKRWKERGGNDNPFTREHILSQKAPQAVPLSPFCELKQVSVNAVLAEMGL